MQPFVSIVLDTKLYQNIGLKEFRNVIAVNRLLYAVTRQFIERHFIERTIYRTNSLSNLQCIEPTMYRTDSLSNL